MLCCVVFDLLRAVLPQLNTVHTAPLTEFGSGSCEEVTDEKVLFLKIVLSLKPSLCVSRGLWDDFSRVHYTVK